MFINITIHHEVFLLIGWEIRSMTVLLKVQAIQSIFARTTKPYKQSNVSTDLFARCHLYTNVSRMHCATERQGCLPKVVISSVMIGDLEGQEVLDEPVRMDLDVAIPREGRRGIARGSSLKHPNWNIQHPIFVVKTAIPTTAFDAWNEEYGWRGSAFLWWLRTRPLR